METILILLIVLSGAYTLFSLYCVMEFFGAKGSETKGAPCLPVSILKPLKGADPELRKNIGSFCRQDYPEYEVVLGFTDPHDEAMPIARETAASCPEGKVQVVIGREDLGVNRKVSNLHGLIRASRHPLIAISDSDMRADRNYLRTVAGEYLAGENIGLVTSLYKISDPVSAGAALESLTIALDFIPSVLVARRIEGVTFGLGASMLVSKQALERAGGISAVADFLADDYQIGNRLSKKGYRIILSRYVLEDVVGAMSFAGYLTHQLRWARTYRACRPGGFLGYGITHLLPLSFLLLIAYGPTPLSVLLPAAALALRAALAFALYGKVIRTRRWLRWLVLLPLKDMLSLGIWAWSFLGRKVYWRGRYYELLPGGRIRGEASGTR